MNEEKNISLKEAAALVASLPKSRAVSRWFYSADLWSKKPKDGGLEVSIRLDEFYGRRSLKLEVWAPDKFTFLSSAHLFLTLRIPSKGAGRTSMKVSGFVGGKKSDYAMAYVKSNIERNIKFGKN